MTVNRRCGFSLISEGRRFADYSCHSLAAHMRKITVLVADDHTIVRQGLKHLIEIAEDIEVIGEAADGEAVIKEAKRLLPNVILLDIAMPKSSGIESARRLSKEVPVSKILMLSTYHDDQEVHLAIAAGAT